MPASYAKQEKSRGLEYHCMPFRNSQTYVTLFALPGWSLNHYSGYSYLMQYLCAVVWALEHPDYWESEICKAAQRAGCSDIQACDSCDTISTHIIATGTTNSPVGWFPYKWWCIYNFPGPGPWELNFPNSSYNLCTTLYDFLISSLEILVRILWSCVWQVTPWVTLCESRIPTFIVSFPRSFCFECGWLIPSLLQNWI